MLGVSGDNFSKNYSLVMNDITFRVLLLILFHLNLSTKEADVKTAFLYGEEEIYMKCLLYMKDVRRDDCIILQKFICGLVKAIRQYKKIAL